MKKKILILLTVSLMGTLGLSGCGSTTVSKDMSVLEKQIEELKTENKTLKTENEKLKKGIIIENIGGVGESVPAITGDSDSKEKEYIKDFLKLDFAKVSMCESYNGKELGLKEISVKNTGSKNIEELIITVYFQDENGKDIAENSFMVIGGYDGGGTLKSNYSWKMEDDKYFPFENLPDEIEASKNRIEISDIKFGL